MLTLLIFLATFSLLVFVHEWGHMIAAKRQGIGVEEFGFGFPPRIASVTWRGTRYSINLIPLGGFVRIKGEEEGVVGDNTSFANRSVGARALVVVAGVTMNVVLGWVLLSYGFLSGTPQIITGSIPNAHIRDRHLEVVSVLPDSPAAAARIEAGDHVLRVNDTTVTTVEDLQNAIAPLAGQSTAVALKRNDREETVNVVPVYREDTKRVVIGIGLEDVGIISYPFFTALGKGAQVTWEVLREIVKSFGVLVRDIVVTRHVSADLAGPIGIAVMTGQVAERGFAYLIQFAALLSLNLAVLNLLPIPALDGGKLLFLAIEKIRRRAVTPEVEQRFQRIGFFALLALVVLVTYRDIVNLFVR